MLPRFSLRLLAFFFRSRLILFHFHLLLWAFNLKLLKFHLSARLASLKGFGVRLLVSDLAFNGTIVQFEAYPIR